MIDSYSRSCRESLLGREGLIGLSETKGLIRLSAANVYFHALHLSFTLPRGPQWLIEIDSIDQISYCTLILIDKALEKAVQLSMTLAIASLCGTK